MPHPAMSALERTAEASRHLAFCASRASAKSLRASALFWPSVFMTAGATRTSFRPYPLPIPAPRSRSPPIGCAVCRPSKAGPDSAVSEDDPDANVLDSNAPVAAFARAFAVAGRVSVRAVQAVAVACREGAAGAAHPLVAAGAFAVRAAAVARLFGVPGPAAGEADRAAALAAGRSGAPGIVAARRLGSFRS